MSNWAKPDTAEAPPRSDFIKPKDLVGRLLGFEVLNFERQVERENSKYGPKDTVYANVTVLDGPEAGHVYSNSPIDTTVLVRQLKKKIGEKVLGRLDRDFDNRGAYYLADPTDEDVKIAEAGGKAQSSGKAPF